MSSSAPDDALGDPDRLRALHRLQLLDGPPQDAYDRLTRLVRATLGVPVALVTLLDRHRQFFLSADGLAEPWASRRETPLTHSFCQHVLLRGEPLVVADATADHSLAGNRAIDELGVVAYLGMPLCLPDGHVIGVLCAIDDKPRTWTAEQQAALADLAALGADQIALRELALELDARVAAEMTARLATREELARKGRLEALGQLAGGVAHDFGNVLQAVQSGVQLARNALARDPANPDPARALRMLDAVGESVRRGAAVTRRLLGFARRGERTETAIEVAPVLHELREMLATTLNRPGLDLSVEAEPDLELGVDRGELEAVLINLATNARDAMPEGGRLSLRAARETVTGPGHPAGLQPRCYVRLTTTDTGTGMSEDVLARAAEPFFTTKPQGAGTGLGLSMARDFAQNAGGGLLIESAQGRGTQVTLWLPRHGADAA